MAIIKFDNITYSYDGTRNVLNNISFSIEAGRYVSIIGHNGSGKSTLAKLMIGLLENKSGKIVLFDTLLDHKSIRDLRTRLGIVFQNPDNQFIGATVADDIAFGLENRQIPHEQMEGIINEYAGKVNMLDFLDKEPSNLSGGQKQRVAIAGILAMKPDIMIFDEATSMLDPKGKREIRELTKKMRTENKDLTIIAITHDIEEAYQSDEIIVLNNGKIELQGTPKEVFKQKDKLREIDLELPFAYLFKEELVKQNIEAKDTDNLSQLVDSLCQ
jgi:energy-coupling factor transport system ATP-binding protein